jgi:hypothetical protein
MVGRTDVVSPCALRATCELGPGRSTASGPASHQGSDATWDSHANNARLLWKATIVDSPEAKRSSDEESEGTDFEELGDAPVAALGLSSNDAEALRQALGVRTVRDLAENRYIRRAQAIVHLVHGSK